MTIAGEIRERLLRQSWMANDGMWFYQVAETFGIEQANQLNGKIVRSFGRLEMARLLRALGVTEIDAVAKYRRIFALATELFVDEMFVYDDDMHGSRHRLCVRQCFAHQGVTRAGLDKVYRCGPAQRALGWFDAMGLDVAVTPEVGLCQLAHTGECTYEFTISTPMASKSAT